MESPFIQYEWEIEDLKKENTELKERIIFLGDLIFKARDLAKDIMTFYPACTKSVYNKAEEFLEELNDRRFS